MKPTVLVSEDSRLALNDREEERLAHHPPPLEMPLSECERIARIAFRISQLESDGKVLPASALRPWAEMTESDRVRARATVYRIVQALCLTGWVESA